MRKIRPALVALGFAVSTAGVSATSWTDEAGIGKSEGPAPAKCCSSDKLKADLKEMETLVSELKAGLSKSTQHTDEIRSKAVRLRTLAGHYEAQADKSQLATIRSIFSKFTKSDYEAYEQMSGSASGDIFSRAERLRNYCQNTDAKLFVEGKSNCLQGVDSMPPQRHLAPGDGLLRMPRIPDSQHFSRPRIRDGSREFVYPKE